MGEENNEIAHPDEPEADWLLRMLVTHANMGAGQSIILQVSGTTIAGNLISGKQYMELMAQQSESVMVVPPGMEEYPKMTSDFYRSIGTKYYEKPADAPDDWSWPEPNFIHLSDARIITASETMPSRGGFLWRGRLGQVDGFALGTVTRT